MEPQTAEATRPQNTRKQRSRSQPSNPTSDAQPGRPNNQASNPNGQKKRQNRRRSAAAKENLKPSEKADPPTTPPRPVHSSHNNHDGAPSTSNRKAGCSRKKSHQIEDNGTAASLPVNYSTHQGKKNDSFAKHANRSPNRQVQSDYETPAKKPSQFYAGPTFHASPAASSLPIPKFFSQRSAEKVSPPDISKEAPHSEESSGSTSEDSPSLGHSLFAAQQPERDPSPLDIFFKADREEKAKRLFESGAAADPGANPDTGRGTRSESPAVTRSFGHARHPTGGSSIFQMDLGNASDSTLVGNAQLPPTVPCYGEESRAPSAVPTMGSSTGAGNTDKTAEIEAQARAKTEALKSLLLFSPAKVQRTVSDEPKVAGARYSSAGQSTAASTSKPDRVFSATPPALGARPKTSSGAHLSGFASDGGSSGRSTGRFSGPLDRTPSPFYTSPYASTLSGPPSTSLSSLSSSSVNKKTGDALAGGSPLAKAKRTSQPAMSSNLRRELKEPNSPSTMALDNSPSAGQRYQKIPPGSSGLTTPTPASRTNKSAFVPIAILKNPKHQQEKEQLQKIKVVEQTKKVDEEVNRLGVAKAPMTSGRKFRPEDALRATLGNIGSLEAPIASSAATTNEQPAPASAIPNETIEAELRRLLKIDSLRAGTAGGVPSY